MGDIYTNPPQSRNEAILRATIDGTEYTAPPQSRIEDLLLELKEAIEQGGTGEGDMKKSVYDSDLAVATAGGIKMFVNQKIGTLPQRVGSLETTAGVLEGEVASIEDTLDGLGTASTKNSTSVVTQSTDLVESGAVYDGIKSAYQLVEDTVGFNGQNYIKPTQGDVSTSGVKFIRNSDNSITVIDGPTTGGCVYLFDSAFTCKANKKYRLKGCPSGGGTEQSNYWVGAYIDSSITDERKDTGSGCVFSFDADTVINIRLRLPSGFTPPNDFTFYPMLTDANNLNSTYVPNHPSVDELKADNSVIGTVEGANASKAWSVGEHFIKDGQFKEVTQPIASGGAISDSNTVDKPISEIVNNIYMYRGILSANTDLDTYNTVDKAGIYGCDGNALTNKPSDFNGYGQMFVYTKGGLVMQEIKGNGVQYTRIYAGGNWRNWFKYTGTEML